MILGWPVFAVALGVSVTALGVAYGLEKFFPRRIALIAFAIALTLAIGGLFMTDFVADRDLAAYRAAEEAGRQTARHGATDASSIWLGTLIAFLSAVLFSFALLPRRMAWLAAVLAFPVTLWAIDAWVWGLVGFACSFDRMCP